MTRVRLLIALVLIQSLPAMCQAAEQPRAPLPMLAKPIVIDGDVSDWEGAGAVSVPVWTRSDICFGAFGYRWGGPADVSMEGYCGWSAEGLCMAIVVADNVVENLRTDDQIYLEDSIELYVDGRRPEVQATSPYSAGAYQIMVTPPLPGRPAHAVINDRDGEIPDLRVAAKSTPTGYVIETLIPWRAFPELRPRPGAPIAFNFAVNDYDGSDPKAERPGQLNRDGAQLMWEHPEGCLKWELAGPQGARDEIAPGPFLAFDVPSIIAAAAPPPLTAAVGTALSPRAGSVRFTVATADGRLLLDRAVPVSPAPPPWDGAVQAVLDWPGDVPIPGGVLTIGASVNDRSGRPFATASRRVLVQQVPGAGR